MQNALQTNANYDQHNAWYNSLFATEIKTEPGTSPIPRHITPPPASTPATPHSQLEQYLSRQHQQNINAAMNATMAMTPSPQNNDNNMQHFFDAKMQQQQYQQQQYQQQYQNAQQAVAQNRMATAAAAAYMPMGFNQLTPPGLPAHYYNNDDLNQAANNHNHNHSGLHQKSSASPQPCSTHQQYNALMELKLQNALTPSNTPPMDTQTLNSSLQQSPATAHQSSSLKDEQEADKEHDIINDSNEDLSNLDDDAKFFESIYKPRYNSHGKLSTYPCKDCGQIFDTKAKFWIHRESHIKPEKKIRCRLYPRCPFVTDLKHHMEFHEKNHRNEKPHKCQEPGCEYSCATKAMLTSHQKSHSNVYPFKCADCDYAVKFLHSLKIHCRDKKHKGVMLDDEGKPNTAAVIDVYGRKRGPKRKGSLTGNTKRERSLSGSRLSVGKSQLSAALQDFKMAQQQQQQEQPMCISPAKSDSSSSNEMPTPKHQQLMPLDQMQQQQQQLSSLLPPLASILQQNSNMAFFPYWNLQMLAAQQQAVQQLQNQQQQAQSLKQTNEQDSDDEEDNDEVDWKSVDSAMDLSQPTDEARRSPEDHNAIDLKINADSKSVETPIGGKGRVNKLTTRSTSEESLSDAANNGPNTSASSTSNDSGTAISNESDGETAASTVSIKPAGAVHECKYCDIYFKDAVLYTIHMGYHSCDDVFKCNMCGEKCDGPVGLFVHMARNPHA